MLAFTVLRATPLPCSAQSSPAPYARLSLDAVNYAGPGRDAQYDLHDSEIKIGLLAPLAGPRQKEGKALVEAAKLAIEDEAVSPFPDGRRLSIVLRDQNGLWGRAANEIVHFVYEDQAVAIITSSDGASAHLAEQVANKIGIPILTLSTDPTSTEINLPWIFRLGPTDTQQARIFARDIYVARKLKRVLLVTENGHDGRVGGEEFQKAVHELNAPPVTQLETDPADADTNSRVHQIVAERPEAVVLWTGPQAAARLAPRLRSELPATPIYFCQEAAQMSEVVHLENIWVVISRNTNNPLREAFEARYRARSGTYPSPAAAQIYDAVRVLAAALRRSGPNRARLRDSLVGLANYTGASGVIAFDHAGNDLGEATLSTLR